MVRPAMASRITLLVSCLLLLVLAANSAPHAEIEIHHRMPNLRDLNAASSSPPLTATTTNSRGETTHHGNGGATTTTAPIASSFDDAVLSADASLPIEPVKQYPDSRAWDLDRECNAHVASLTKHCNTSVRLTAVCHSYCNATATVAAAAATTSAAAAGSTLSFDSPWFVVRSFVIAGAVAFSLATLHSAPGNYERLMTLASLCFIVSAAVWSLQGVLSMWVAFSAGTTITAQQSYGAAALHWVRSFFEGPYSPILVFNGVNFTASVVVYAVGAVITVLLEIPLVVLWVSSHLMKWWFYHHYRTPQSQVQAQSSQFVPFPPIDFSSSLDDKHLSLSDSPDPAAAKCSPLTPRLKGKILAQLQAVEAEQQLKAKAQQAAAIADGAAQFAQWENFLRFLIWALPTWSLTAWTFVADQHRHSMDSQAFLVTSAFKLFACGINWFLPQLGFLTFLASAGMDFCAVTKIFKFAIF